MKLLLINDRLKETGGAERAFYSQKRLLEEKGHRVELIGSNRDEDFRSWFSRWASLRYYRLASAALCRFEPEIVHCHNITRTLSPTPLLAARRLNVPVVMTIHDPALLCAKSWGITKAGSPCPGFGVKCLCRCDGERNGVLAQPYYLARLAKTAIHRRMIGRYCSQFVCTSRALYDLVRREFGLTPERISCLPDFVEGPPAPSTAESDIDPHLFVFAGRLVKAKGAALAIEALARLVHDGLREIKFEIIGDGPERENLLQLTQLLGVGAQVSFAGRLDEAALAARFRRSAAAVMPSLWLENNPHAAMEAMNQRRPVIAPRAGGFPDLIEHERTGFLFERGDAADLSRCIRTVYGNAALSCRLGEEGCRKLSREFSREEHYRKLMEIYTRLTARDR